MSGQDFDNFLIGSKAPTTIPIFKDGKYVASMDRVRAYALVDRGVLDIKNNEGHVRKDKKSE